MKLRAYLEDRKMTADAFGGLLGVSGHAVGKWIRGERVPRPDVMQKIVEETNGAVRPNDFYGAAGGAPTPPGDASVHPPGERRQRFFLPFSSLVPGFSEDAKYRRCPNK